MIPLPPSLFFLVEPFCRWPWARTETPATVEVSMEPSDVGRCQTSMWILTITMVSHPHLPDFSSHQAKLSLCFCLICALVHLDPGIESSVLAGHEDSVWGLTYSTVHHRLASCSADGTIRIWDPQNSAPCLSVFNKERGRTSVLRICLWALFCVQAAQLHHFLCSPRARHAHLGGLCGYWPQPGGSVLWRWRDAALRPQHRAEHHCTRDADQGWYVVDPGPNL